MSIHLEARFWSRYFKQAFSKQIDLYCNSIIERVFPPFSSIGEEADAVAQAAYEQQGELPWNGRSDMADAAETSLEAGIEYFQALEAVRQSVMNIVHAGLYHLLEQQLIVFHRRQVLHPSEETDQSLISQKVLRQRLIQGGIDITTTPSWPKLDELRLVANCIKHAEGPSATELRSRRPELFVHPSLRGEDFFGSAATASVYQPLAGLDLYLDENDLRTYQAACVSFWNEFGILIVQHEFGGSE